MRAKRVTVAATARGAVVAPSPGPGPGRAAAGRARTAATTTTPVRTKTAITAGEASGESLLRRKDCYATKDDEVPGGPVPTEFVAVTLQV